MKPIHKPAQISTEKGSGRKTRSPAVGFAAFLAFLLFSVFGKTVHGAEISHMAIRNAEETLVISVEVKNAFTEKIKEAVMNGISTSFSYVVTLTRTRSLLPDKRVHEIRVTNTLRYDTLRNTYVVRRSWENYRPLNTDSFAEARQWMSEISDVPVIPLASLERDTRYRVNAKAELDKIRLPFFLNYIFFFTSLWDFETSWESVDFIY